MKKVFIFAFAFMALTCASCGNKQAGNAPQADSVATDSVAIVDNADPEAIASDLQTKLEAKDSEGFKQAVEIAKQKIDELVKAGNVEEAQAYASKVKAFVDENAETIKQLAGGNETVSSLVNTINALPASAESAVNEAGEAVKADAQQAVDDAKSAAKAKVEEAKSAASAKVDETKTKAKQKAADEVNKAKDKANQEVNKAANKALKGIGL